MEPRDSTDDCHSESPADRNETDSSERRESDDERPSSHDVEQTADMTSHSGTGERPDPNSLNLSRRAIITGVSFVVASVTAVVLSDTLTDGSDSTPPHFGYGGERLDIPASEAGSAATDPSQTQGYGEYGYGGYPVESN